MKCPFCGGNIAPHREPVGGGNIYPRYTALCPMCGASGWASASKPDAELRQAALDDLAEWLDVCPRCGGKAEYKNDW